MLTDSKYTNISNPKFTLQNILAEEVIIGTLLSSKSLKSNILKSINSHFFSIKKYRLLYSALNNIDKTNNETNIIQIIDQLWQTNLLTEMGGVTNLLNNIQKSKNFYLSENLYSNLKYFINLLHHYYIKRLFIQYSCNLIQINYFYNLSINKIYRIATEQLNTIANLTNINESKNIHNEISYLLSEIQFSSNNTSYLRYGFKDLDKITNGLRDGDLVIIAGRPSMGKTSFAINILHHLTVKLNQPVHFFSLEMSKKEILNKLISLASQVETNKIEQKSVKKKDWVNLQIACKAIINSSLVIDDNGQSSIEYINAQCENYKLKKSIIIIDYLQLIQVDKQNTENRSQEIGDITRRLKLLAKDIKTTVVVLSQLNRNIENRVDKRPLLSDLRESGCIDLFNLPEIQNFKTCYSIEIMHCHNKFYTLNRTRNLKIIKNRTQFTFALINLERTILSITHNHKVLYYNLWIKEDQTKYSSYKSIKPKNLFNLRFTIELNKVIKIKCLGKNKVYDISLTKYHNFSLDNFIIHNSIEQDADLILMLYKDEDNLSNEIIDVVIAKHRHGPTGAFQLLFHADVCTFKDMKEPDLFL